MIYCPTCNVTVTTDENGVCPECQNKPAESAYRVVRESRPGRWVTEGHSESFSDAWNYARALRVTSADRLMVVGAEGEFPVK